MRSLRSFLAGLRALIRRDADRQEIDRELQQYVQAAADDRMAGGMDPGAARREALATLGSLAARRDEVRAAGWEHAVDTLVQDVRFGARLIRRSPGFSLAVVFTLALGIGGNTAIATLIDTIYFRPLPIPAVGRVLRLLDSRVAADGQRQVSSMRSPHVPVIRAQHALFAGVAAMYGEDLTLTGGAAPERVSVVFRTTGWREVLGVLPAVGRDFTADEEQRGDASGSALISDGLWHRRFGAAPVDGLTLHVDGRPYGIVGVMPPGFRFPYDADVWMPHAIDVTDRGRDYAVFARLRDGVSPAMAEAALQAASAAIRSESPGSLQGYAVAVRSLQDNLIDNQARTTFALLSVVGFLLLLACLNVSTLVMARAMVRRKEFTLRTALGASRFRQARQTITETMLLSLAGGGAGVVIAAWLGSVTAALLPQNISQQLGVASPDLDWRVLLVALMLTLGAGLAVGLAPALRRTRDPGEGLREGGRSLRADGGPGQTVLHAFVVGQAALAMVLLAGAGLMLQGVQRLQHRDLGFRPAALLNMEITPSRSRHPRGPERALFLRQIEDAIAAVPGVAAIGSTTVNPLGGASWGAPILVDGRGAGASDVFNVNHRLVTPHLFEAMGIPIVRGRAFSWRDDAAHAPVAIVSDRLARRFWSGGEAIGHRVRVAREGSPWLTIVGVAGNVLDQRDPEDPPDTWYLPYAQQAAGPAADEIHLMLRVRGDSAGPAAAVRGAVQRVDPTLPVTNITTMDRYYRDTFERERVGATVTFGFGAFGLLLGALGVYGVMAFMVTARTPEIAVRLTLGATPGRILRLVLGRAGLLTGAGLMAGFLASNPHEPADGAIRTGGASPRTARACRRRRRAPRGIAPRVVPARPARRLRGSPRGAPDRIGGDRRRGAAMGPMPWSLAGVVRGRPAPSQGR